jgi:putative transposase
MPCWMNSFKETMANTYTQIHIHAIFAIKNRVSLIDASWESRLYEYIAGTIRSNNHKPLVVNGMPDHIHAVFGLGTNQSISDLLDVIKSCSSKWINENNFLKNKFNWQKGYGAFACSKSRLPALIKYVQNQKEHHRKKTFITEYIEFLEKNEIEYNPKYIFIDPNDV